MPYCDQAYFLHVYLSITSRRVDVRCLELKTDWTLPVAVSR